MIVPILPMYLNDPSRLEGFILIQYLKDTRIELRCNFITIAEHLINFLSCCYLGLLCLNKETIYIGPSANRPDPLKADKKLIKTE
jgi:hypothetical protein